MCECSGDHTTSGLNSTKKLKYMGIAVQDTSLIHYYALFVHLCEGWVFQDQNIVRLKHF